MKPSRRRFDLQWTPAPRSAYARRRRSTAFADQFVEPHRSEILTLLRSIQEGHEALLGYRERRVSMGAIVRLESPKGKDAA